MADTLSDEELIARLRRRNIVVADPYGPEPDKLCHQAADRLAALSARVRELEFGVREIAGMKREKMTATHDDWEPSAATLHRVQSLAAALSQKSNT